jgi:quinolinate synthase
MNAEQTRRLHETARAIWQMVAHDCESADLADAADIVGDQIDLGKLSAEDRAAFNELSLAEMRATLSDALRDFF